MIILRCIDSRSIFLEKVIFPWEEWCFDSPTGSRVEIWSYGVAGVELLETMASDQLRCPQPAECIA